MFMLVGRFPGSQGISDSLKWALVVSLIAHVLVLWPATVPSRSANEPGGLLNATLRQRFEPRVMPAPRPVVKPAPSIAVPPLGLVVGSTVAPTLPSTLPRAVVDEVLPTEPVAAAQADINVGPAADGIRRYRLTLASQAKRFRQYPALASASGWQGTAEIRLDIRGEGRAPDVRLLRSSGRDLLDQAALTMIATAADRAEIPPVLRGQIFAVTLPVVFNLGE